MASIPRAVQGNSSDYAARRLANLRPDLYDKVIKRELKAGQALTLAGLRKKVVQLSRDPMTAACQVLSQYGLEFAGEMLAWLGGLMDEVEQPDAEDA
jgi:hypothetical protein